MANHLKSHPLAKKQLLAAQAKQVITDAHDTAAIKDVQKDYQEAQDVAREILGKPALARKMPISRAITEYFESADIRKFQMKSERQRRVDMEIMQFLARCSLPFSIVDHPAFVQ